MTVVHIRRERTQRAADAPRVRLLLRRLCFAAILLMGLSIGVLAILRINRVAQQLHRDPKVGTIWVAGVAYGSKPMLELNGIHIFGKAETLVSRFSGDAGGLEIWFACRSNLRGKPLLECHRIGKTAFTDDLGQEYQGYLDFHGSYVGVYLPGYDHAAHRLTCALHWMPRSPAAPTPVSAPMLFYIDLPPTNRLLPSANRLSVAAASQTRQGITVTASSARLDAPKLSTTMDSQRDLIFHLDVRGGTLACSNVDTLLTDTSKPGGVARAGGVPTQRLVAPWNAAPPPQNSLQITDPYGVPLLATKAKVVPMMSLDATRCTREHDGAVWIAPVNGAGQGTDVIHLHLYVQPTNRSQPPVPFDLTLPVGADDEI